MQDCLERLLAARVPLVPEVVLPYAVVAARNLVSSHAKSAMRLRPRPRAAATPPTRTGPKTSCWQERPGGR